MNQSLSAETLIENLRKQYRKRPKSKAEEDNKRPKSPGDSSSDEDSEGFDWGRLGKAAGKFFATVPPFETLNGPLQRESSADFQE
jgi:hypothetical protein